METKQQQKEDYPPASCLWLSDCKEINSFSKNMDQVEFPPNWKKNITHYEEENTNLWTLTLLAENHAW